MPFLKKIFPTEQITAGEGAKGHIFTACCPNQIICRNTVSFVLPLRALYPLMPRPRSIHELGLCPQTAWIVPLGTLGRAKVGFPNRTRCRPHEKFFRLFCPERATLIVWATGCSIINSNFFTLFFSFLSLAKASTACPSLCSVGAGNISYT